MTLYSKGHILLNAEFQQLVQRAECEHVWYAQQQQRVQWQYWFARRTGSQLRTDTVCEKVGTR